MQLKKKLVITLGVVVCVPILILGSIIYVNLNGTGIVRDEWILLGVVLVSITITILAIAILINRVLTPMINKLLIIENRLKKTQETFTDCENELKLTKEKLDTTKIRLDKNSHELKITEQRYKMMLDTVEEVVWEYNVNDKTLFVTEKWNELIHGQSGMLNGEEVLDKILEPRVVESFKKQVNDCIQKNIVSFNQELYIKTYSGEYKWIYCIGNSIKNCEDEVEKITGVLKDITIKKQSEERVRKIEFFDELTGCLNKRTFMKSLNAWVSSADGSKGGGLLFIDLDDFKKVNDTLGHEEGDKLLSFVGKSLRQILPRGTFLSRFGGDEFVVFKPDFEDKSEIDEMIDNIFMMFEEKVNNNVRSIHTTCSIGVACYPGDGKNSDSLLRNADTAMYRAKEIGKNTYSFYNSEMTETLDRRIMIETAIRGAITNGNLYLMYQPIVDVKSEKTVAVETLVRLNDEKVGFISPAEFIPISEETGLIVPTGDWVMKEAIKSITECHDKGYTHLGVTINVSAIQLREENFLSKLKKIVKKINIPMELIKLEVTETVLMDNLEKNIELFNKIREMGIKIALDDFGTGYSSLNYLRIIPLDVLKIDKSFIDEVTSSPELSQIVDSIISMAHALNITVVAEGVENKEQLEILKEKGCDLIQGYVYSKPLMPEKLQERLENEAKLEENRLEGSEIIEETIEI